MRLILDVDKLDGSQQRFWMNLGEVLRVGRSSSADVCIPGDFQLAEHHFSIVGAAEGWTLQTMPGARVGVNGQLQQNCGLNHGDRIIAGETEFHITIEQPTHLDAERLVPAVHTPAPATRVTATYKKSLCDSGVVRIEVTLNESLLIELLDQVRGESQLWCAFNAQRLGNSILGIKPATADLFAQAPYEIRESDSLMLGVLPLEPSVLSNVQKAASADGALILMSTTPLEQLLEQQKFVWAWYARPSIIDQQLRVGSKHLAEKLLAALETVILLGNSRHDVTLFVPPELCESTLAKLNLISA